MIPTGLQIILLSTWTALVIGSCIRYLSWRRASKLPDFDPDQRLAARHSLASLAVWWVLLALFSLACVTGKLGLSVLVGGASFIGMLEFQHMFARRNADSRVLLWLASSLGLAHYVLLQWLPVEQLLPPSILALLLAIMTQQLIRGNVRNYLRTTAGYIWGATVIVLCLSFVVALTDLPVSTSRWNAGPVGWTVYLVLIAQSSDIAQALIGRRIGRTKIIPRVSPGKSWEGLTAGLVVSCLLAWVLAYPLTTLPEGRSLWQGFVISALGGVLVGLTAFVGDLNISALKREAGLKDSSHLFPGMGGMLDRVDSLTLSAPALYVYASFWTNHLQ